MAINVYNGTSGRATTCCCVGLIVACVEIAIAFTVFGSVAVESTYNARQDTELLASVVSDNSNFDSNYSGQLPFEVGNMAFVCRYLLPNPGAASAPIRAYT